MGDVAISDLLAGLGLTAGDADLGRLVLEGAGLTNPRKSRINDAKVDAARIAIDLELARLCRRCADRSRGEARALVVVSAEACAVCGGSANTRALDALAAAAAASSVTRLVVVGGSPDIRRELGALPLPLEVRLIVGVDRRTGEQARRDVDWADVIVVCGSSELYHRVSNLYTREPAARGKLVVSSRRGVEAIAGEVVEHLRRRAEGPEPAQ
jgi:hypothetical protein